MARDGRIDQLGTVCRVPRQRAFFIRFDMAAVSKHVRYKNCSEPSSHRFLGHPRPSDKLRIPKSFTGGKLRD